MTPTINTNSIAPMREIQWNFNSTTGYYDIENAFTSNDNAGNLAVIQSKILITLNTFQNEWAADPTFGIPFNTMKENSNDPDVLSQIIVNQILSVQNTNSVNILEFDYQAANRLFSASFSVNTVYGVTTVVIGQ